MSAERNYWAAVSSLREAETLAAMTGGVSGPADEPPKPGEEASWVDDWARRAGESLARAREWSASRKRMLRERAQRIVSRVRDGAASVRRAVGAPITKANETFQDVVRSVNNLSYSLLGAEVLLTAALAFAAWKLFFK
jgi:hypothetical protein